LGEGNIPSFSQTRRIGKHETEHCEQIESLLK
jgi:hypothetical protein